MTDEEKRVINDLREASRYCFIHGDSGNCAEASILTAIDLIEQLSGKLDQAVAENEAIRQTHVTPEAYQQVVDELERVKRERDAAVRDMRLIANGDACYVCAHRDDKDWHKAHNPDNCWEWNDQCAENGGTEDATD